MWSVMLMRTVLVCSLFATMLSAQRDDRMLFDFEANGFKGWVRKGEAFGKQPATGALPKQSSVSGMCGRGLASSFHGGDDATGRLTSASFVVDRRYLRFFVGGGDDAKLVVQLQKGAQVLFEATGSNSEQLRPVQWDLQQHIGAKLRLVLVDEQTTAWGHLLVDHFVLTDDPSSGPPVSIGPRRHIYTPPSAPKQPRFALNDHCFVQAADKQWHMFGIVFTEPGTPSIDGRSFAHATAPSLLGPWQPVKATLQIDERAGETRLWAPHVVAHGNRWWMYYHAGGRDQRRSLLHAATSRDLSTWQRAKKNPMVVDGFQARDPFLLKGADGWRMYYTATFPSAGGHHTVVVRKSKDLINWSEPHHAYRDARTGTDYGPTESPFVVVRGRYAYLFVGSSVSGEYDRTRVFRSRDLDNWVPTDLVTTLRVHGAEVAQDGQGRWFASHAGNNRGGLWLARMYWCDGVAN